MLLGGALRRTSRLGLLAATAGASAALVDRARCLTVELDDTSIKALKTSLAAAVEDVKPPVARRAPHVVHFGINPEDPSENRGVEPMRPPIELIDDLYWLRDDERKNEEMPKHLHAENDYTDVRTAHLAQFRETLYTEMLSHIQEDDDDYPVPSGDGYECTAVSLEPCERCPYSSRSARVNVPHVASQTGFAPSRANPSSSISAARLEQQSMLRRCI